MWNFRYVCLSHVFLICGSLDMCIYNMCFSYVDLSFESLDMCVWTAVPIETKKLETDTGEDLRDEKN